MKSNRKILINISWIIVMMTILYGNNLLAKSSFSGSRLKNACLSYISNLVEKDSDVRISEIEDQFFEETGVIARCDARTNSLRGNTYVALEFLDHEEKLIRRVEVPVNIKVYKDVPTAVYTLQKDKILMINDITYNRMDVTYLDESKIPGIEKIVGKKVNRQINKGEVISANYLENEVLVNRGGKVNIIVQSGAVSIRTSGVALQDAAIGDIVRVQREGSRQSLQGKVYDDGTVYINAR
jgi:flagella basal body P-ring formation protein FlgA